MTDWWSSDPLANSVQAKAGGDWWSQDPKPGEAAKPIAPETVAIGDLLTRSGQAREQGRQTGAKAGAASTFGNSVQAGALANFNDEIAGVSRASGLPDWTPPALAVPVGAARLGLDALGLTSGQATQSYEDQRDYVRGYQEAAHEARPVASIGGEIAGGLALPLSRVGAAAGLPGAIRQGVATGASYGALAGAGSGEGVEDRLTQGAKGAGIGAGLGATLPIVGAVAAPVLAPIASNIAARVNPAAYAERQVGRAAQRSGQTPEEIADRVGRAAAEGQDEYRLLDGLGHDGARLGAVVAKNPGEGRAQLRDFLNQRQEGQGYRLGNALAEGLDAPETAQAATNRMTAARREMDNEAFGAVRRDADPVNVTPAVQRIDETLRPGATGELDLRNGIAWDSAESALAKARSLLTDGNSQVADFAVVQRARGDIADAAEEALRKGKGNMARLLRGVRDALDREMENASPGFREAMSRSRAAANEVDAIEVGSAAATRGRSEDKLRTFAAMTPEEQAAFRTGYADRAIGRVQGGAEGTNAARPFTSLAARTELPAVAAPGRGEALMRQIERESEMFANRAQTTGGSSTYENFADNANVGLNATALGQLLRGNLTGAMVDTVARGAAALNGNTEAVRNEMARLLMEGDRGRILTMLLRLGQEDARRRGIGESARRSVVRVTIPTVTEPQRPPLPSPR